MRFRLCVSFIAIALQWHAHGLGAEQIIVYHSVKDLVARSVAERFEKETGISVRLVPENGRPKSEELSDRLIAEENGPSTDLLWAEAPVSAVILKSKGLSAPYESPSAKNLPKQYSDPEHYWTGFAAGAVVILYNQDLLRIPERMDQDRKMKLRTHLTKQGAILAYPLILSFRSP